MSTLSRIVAVLLISAAAVVLPGTPALAKAHPHHPHHSPMHSPGCHSDSETPAPAPGNLDCCVAGHDVALLAGGFLLHPPAAVAARPEFEAFEIGRSALAGLVSFSDRHGPPRITSLRI